jgi:hypothetical protein
MVVHLWVMSPFLRHQRDTIVIVRA